MQDRDKFEYWDLAVRDSRRYQAWSGIRLPVGEIVDTVHRDELGNEAADYGKGIEWIPVAGTEVSPEPPAPPVPATAPLIEYRTIEVPVACCKFCKGWRRFWGALMGCFRIRV